MLQRRRCRCCVSCIFILVICISVFYFSSTFWGTFHANFGDHVNLNKYPDFRKYAKNIVNTMGLDEALHSSNSLKDVPLRLLMKENGNSDVHIPSSMNTTRTFTPKYVIAKTHDLNSEANGPNFLKDVPYERTKEERKTIADKSVSVLDAKISAVPHKDMPKGAEQLKAQEKADREAVGEVPNQNIDQIDTKPVHIVIVTNRRSGSSFLGQIFNQNPSVFFHFEPLKLTEWKQEFYPNATGLVQNILKCRFDSTPYLMDMYNREPLHRESSKVLTSPPLCDLTKLANKLRPIQWCPPLEKQVVMDICKRYKHVAIKMIRMYSISSLEEIVRDPSLNVKVIHLVRDPRGIYVSRTKAEHKQLSLGDHLDKDVAYTCRRMKRNLDFVRGASEWLQGRYIRVRYEDVAEDPNRWAQKLYNFTGLGMVPKDVAEWIRINTQETSNINAYSTQRNSSSTSQAWRKYVSLNIVQHMQELCRLVLQELGYLEVSNETQLSNSSHSLVV